MSTERVARGKGKRRSDNPSWRSQKSPLREKEGKNEARERRDSERRNSERQRRDSERRTAEKRDSERRNSERHDSERCSTEAENRALSSAKPKEATGMSDDADLPKMHSSPLWSEAVTNESGDDESSKENAGAGESKGVKKRRTLCCLRTKGF